MEGLVGKRTSIAADGSSNQVQDPQHNQASRKIPRKNKIKTPQETEAQCFKGSEFPLKR